MDKKRLDILDRYRELTEQMMQPDVIQDIERYKRISKEQAGLEETVAALNDALEIEKQLEEIKEILNGHDEELKELAKSEYSVLRQRAEENEKLTEKLLTPKDPRDSKRLIIEIRAGAGGDEAALFAADLYRMYRNFAENQGLEVSLLDCSETGIGGYKEAVFEVDGEGAFSLFRFESGVHRVQRIPVTEQGGRIHTSTCTVAVMPEADELDFEINPKDLRIDTYRSSGAGGQHVNKTSSAIRITYLPTGLVVTCQDERSQHKNKDKAMSVLRTKLLDEAMEERRSAEAGLRKDQVGTGDRSERIRTYNYPQGRVTDHRIGFTLYKLDAVLSGDLTEIVNKLQEALKLQELKA